MLPFRRCLLLAAGLLSFSIVAEAQSPAPALAIVNTLEGHKELVYSVNFSPDGKHLVSGSFDKSLKLWDVAAAKELKSYSGPSGHTDLVLTTAFSPDGRLIASGAKDNSVKLWDMPISGAYRNYAGASAPVTSQALTPDGTRLVAGLEDGTVKIWNTNDGKEQSVLKLKSKVVALAISANGQWLAVGEANGSINIYQLSDNKVVGQLPAHTNEVRGLGFHPNNQLLFSAGQDGLVKVWNVPGGTPTAPKAPEKAPAPDKNAKTPEKKTPAEQKNTKTDDKNAKPPEKKAATEQKNPKTDDKNPKVAEKTKPEEKKAPAEQKNAKAEEKKPKVEEKDTSPKPVRSFTASPTPITSFAVIDGGNRAVIANQDGLAKVINLTTGNVDKELKGHAGAIQTIAATGNSQLVFTAGVDKKLRCFNVNDGKELKVLLNDALARSLFSSGNSLIVGNSDGTIQVLNITNTPNQPLPESFGKAIHTFKQPASVSSVIMANAASLIYAASQDKTVTSYKIASDTPLRNLAGHGNLVDAVVFSPDGLSIASSSHDGTIRFWNTHDGKQTGEVKLAAQPLYCLAWRGDGKQLAVGSFNRSIRLIDVAGKKVEREIKGLDDKSAPNGHSDAVYSIAYVGNDQLYSAGADGKIKLWTIADGGMAKTLIDPTLKDKAQRDFINTIKLTSDGKKLVAVGNGGWITIWNTADGKLLHSQKLPIGLYGLSINKDGNLIATGNMNGTVYLIKMP
jgi:WD40 repeat protein